MVSALTLSAVTVRRFGKRVLGPVDLTLDGPGPVMVLGPNGAGKTSLLRVMHGIERLSGGTVTRDPALRMAYVFQAPTMLRRSVAENLAYPLRLARMPRDARAAKVEAWLARLGLTGLAAMPATRLSGGERQKLALGRALITRPDLLFLDEPCANLDGATTREIEALLQTEAARGARLIMATHDMGQARRLAAEVIFLRGGTIAERGAAARFDAPQTPEFAAFLRGDIVE